MQSLQVISLAWDAIVKIVALTGVVSALGTWVVLRLTKPLDSYTEELGKQIARHQNLDKLVEETRHFTNAAEKIKADFAHDNWDRQTRFLAKRDLYVTIAEALGELRTCNVEARRMESLRIRGTGGPLFEAQRDKTLRAMEAASEKWLRAVHVAPLMLPDDPFKPLREFEPRQIRFGTPSWESDFEYNIASAQWTLYHFQLAARTDLGFDPMVWKPTILTSSPKPDSHAKPQE